MRKSMGLGLVLAIMGVAALGGPAIATDTYKLDPAHSFAIFKIQHLTAGNTWGRFNNPAGTIVMDADDAKCSISVTLKVADIDTANKQRDEHLKTADFFNEAQFPTITFVSKTIKKVDDKTWDVTGDLTIKGVTKSITVKVVKVGEAKGMQGETRLGLETTFTIKRADYGVDAMPPAVGAEATLMVSMEGIKS